MASEYVLLDPVYEKMSRFVILNSIRRFLKNGPYLKKLCSKIQFLKKNFSQKTMISENSSQQFKCSRTIRMWKLFDVFQYHFNISVFFYPLYYFLIIRSKIAQSIQPIIKPDSGTQPYVHQGQQIFHRLNTVAEVDIDYGLFPDQKITIST